MEEQIKNIYYNNLLTENDLKEIMEDSENEPFECILDNLIELLSDNVKNVALDLLEVVKNFS